ncbi:BZ3500_MvSof-1268-A1-R1_Chr7-3g09628 [Microbotryum saponariae]|uniref:BZ3500_MvSof-1268-A1-R1_Chr7-3g09628 protein n=1 Tax=Microbotryum saponariae TaxID=289078 RepID=A0A2X0NAB9_9BASI|nr:BZ3500_MvSof-1268-A1-R1_Chr7-3g09628 [Microbotryum saponariae]
MAPNDWHQIAGHAAALLMCLAHKVAPIEDKRTERCFVDPPQTRNWTWEPLQFESIDKSRLQADLAAFRCTDVAQEHLASLYLASAEALSASCSESFEITMAKLVTVVCDLDSFRISEAAIRQRFTAEFRLELRRFRDEMLQQVLAASADFSKDVAPLQALKSSFKPSLVQATAGGFSSQVNQILFTAFTQFEHLTKGERLALAKRTGLSQKQVATWFANQRQRRTRQTANPTSVDDLPILEDVAGVHITRVAPPAPSSVPFAPSEHAVDVVRPCQHIPTLQLPSTSAEPLIDFGPFFHRKPTASYDSDVSSLSDQIDSSDFSINSLSSKWSQDAPDSYYGLPLPPASDMQLSFELPPTEAIEHLDYSPDNSIWNAFDSSFSSSSSSADSYLDDYTFQPPMSAEDATPLTCGLLTARQATFAESPSSFGSPPLSTPDVEMDMDADSVFGHISEFGVLTASLNTGLASASPN